jgi:molybdenum transport protein
MGRDVTLPLIADSYLDGYLADDVPLLDLTTHALGIGDRPGRMSFAARGAMVVACIEEAGRIISRSGGCVEIHAGSGTPQKAGALLLTATGPAAALLRAWKVAQTLVEYASGIATTTRAIVDAARTANPDVAVACARKNAPGTKLIALKAILAGGATPHRLGLSETILIFPEHLGFLAELPAEKTIALAKRTASEKKIIVEVGSHADALAWADAGADVIQTEKFEPEAVAAVCKAFASRQRRPLIAAAGGINATNAALYAAAGADILVTSAPYWGKPADVSVGIEPLTD